MTGEELQKIANAHGLGHLKYWKACSMLGQALQMQELPPERFRAWVANCLEMEGFTPEGIDIVADALRSRGKP